MRGVGEVIPPRARRLGVAPLTGRAQVLLQPKRKQAEHFTQNQGVQLDERHVEPTSELTPERRLAVSTGARDDGDLTLHSPIFPGRGLDEKEAARAAPLLRCDHADPPERLQVDLGRRRDAASDHRIETGFAQV